MLSQRDLEDEIKRYPAFIKMALKEHDYQYAYQLSIELDTLQFILGAQ